MPPVVLDAYLDRVQVPRAAVAEPTVATLRALHRAHVDTIPFVSVLSTLGRIPRLDLATVQARLVTEGRGGYCMEHVTLFAAILDAVGLRPQLRLATVGEADAATHLTVLAQPDDDARRWMADVGFGVGILGPLPVPSSPGEGQPLRHGCWEHRVDVAADGRLLLHEHTRDGWQVLHATLDRDVTGEEIDTGNLAAACGTGSPFAGQLVAMRTTDDLRERLVGARLVRNEGTAPSTAELLSPTAAIGVLEERFGVAVGDAERAELERLLAG